MRIPKRVRKIKHGQAVEILWIDAYTPADSGWMTIDGVKRHVKKPMMFRHVGIAIGLEGGSLHLCGVMAQGYDQMQSVFSIPVGCIKKVRVLK
jgi:hypothetical protein